MEVNLDTLDADLAQKIDVLFEFDSVEGEANVNDFTLNGNPFFLVGPGEVKVILVG